MRCLFLFGTRPEAIKLCPLFLEIAADPGLESVFISSGQHGDMLAPVLRFFHIRPHRDLGLMQAGQSLISLTQRLMNAIPPVLEEYHPDLVFVHGDTATAMAGALCAHFAGIPVVHIEAGLRTGDVHAPFPEEFNRRAVDAASDWLFAPTAAAAATLQREGHPSRRIFTVGNTATDALRLCLQATSPPDLLPPESQGRRLILLTAHRRELGEQAMISLLRAIRLQIERRDDLFLFFPVHPSPSVRTAAHAAFDGCPRALLCEPLEVPRMQHLLRRATLLLTDSGGLQEEATYLGLPTLVLRNVTERPEGVAAGVLSLIGTDPRTVGTALSHLLDDAPRLQTMAHPSDVYGNGYVSQRIISILHNQILPSF